MGCRRSEAGGRGIARPATAADVSTQRALRRISALGADDHRYVEWLPLPSREPRIPAGVERPGRNNGIQNRFRPGVRGKNYYACGRPRALLRQSAGQSEADVGGTLQNDATSSCYTVHISEHTRFLCVYKN